MISFCNIPMSTTINYQRKYFAILNKNKQHTAQVPKPIVGIRTPLFSVTYGTLLAMISTKLFSLKSQINKQNSKLLTSVFCSKQNSRAMFVRCFYLNFKCVTDSKCQTTTSSYNLNSDRLRISPARGPIVVYAIYTRHIGPSCGRV